MHMAGYSACIACLGMLRGCGGGERKMKPTGDVGWEFLPCMTALVMVSKWMSSVGSVTIYTGRCNMLQGYTCIVVKELTRS